MIQIYTFFIYYTNKIKYFLKIIGVQNLDSKTLSQK